MTKLTVLRAGVIFLCACSYTAAQQAETAGGRATSSPPSGRPSITLAEVDDKALEQPAANFGG